jgi:outer membrane lipoprotein carrier protein
MRWTLFLLACLLPAAISPAQDDLDSIFARMREKQGAIRTLQAKFVQEKKSTLLSSPIRSEGLISYDSEGRVRWEYLKPDPYTILITGDGFQAYYPALKKVKTARITRMRNRIYHFLLATEPLEKLKAHFQVELRFAKARPTFTLVLTPLTPRLTKYISGVTLYMDKDLLLPVEMLVRERDEDYTRLEFSGHKINAGLPAGTFTLDLPPGTAQEDYQAGGR